MGNLVQNFEITQTFVDKDDSWLGILAAASFSIHSTKIGLKGYSLVQSLFGHDMILLIKHKVDCELICQRNQTQTNKNIIYENIKRVYQDYKVGDKVMLTNNSA